MCRGDNSSGEVSGYSSMAQGAWGFPVNRTTWPNTHFQWESVSAGYYYTCGTIKQGKSFCWGFDPYKNINFPGGKPDWGYSTADGYKGVVASLGWVSTTCTISSVGSKLQCFGADTKGQLSKLPQGYAWSMVSSGGGGHICGVTDKGLGQCWGSNDFGQSNVRDS